MDEIEEILGDVKDKLEKSTGQPLSVESMQTLESLILDSYATGLEDGKRLNDKKLKETIKSQSDTINELRIAQSWSDNPERMGR